MFYNPVNPRDRALERGAPKGMALGCLYPLAVLAAIGFVIHWMWTVGVEAWLRFGPGSIPS